MKKNFLYVAAAALTLTFAACSQQEEVVQEPVKDLITADMTTSYAKISVTMPSVGTRAMEDKFHEGLTSESVVDNIYLVLYNEDNVVVGTGVPTTIGDWTDGSNDITKTQNVVFRLNLLEGEPKPDKVIAFVNYSSTDENADVTLNNTAILEQSIQDLKNGSIKVSADALSNEKGFVMTNSGYYDGDEYVITSKLDPEQIFADASSAGNAASDQLAATIYVERIAAKVSVENKVESEENKTADVVITEEGKEDPVNLVFGIDDAKWGATGTAKDMYLIKKQFAYTSADSWMNGQTYNHRSYWAEGTNWNTPYSGEEGEYAYVIGEKTNSGVDAPLNYLSLLDLLGKEGVKGKGLDMSGFQYVPEHTYNYEKLVEAPLFNVNIPSTSAIIVGKYEVKGGTADYTNGFYLVYNGATAANKAKYTIYNEEGFIEYMKHGNTLYEEGSNTAADVQVDYDKKTGKYTLKANKDLYTVPADNGQSEDNKFTKTFYARHYMEGQAYFYVAITHNIAMTDKNGLYGVVRNHSYQLGVSSVKGLGAPINENYFDGENPTPDPIVPDPDDLKDAFINATINVLNWHVIEQDVKL